jgi:DNA-binding Lrp family transcriptional regulator
MDHDSEMQTRLLAFLKKKPRATIRDIMIELGYSSRNAVHWHVRRLEAAGRLKRPTTVQTPWQVL